MDTYWHLLKKLNNGKTSWADKRRGVSIWNNETKTTIAIHQEKLLNSEQRNEMKEYWAKIIEELTNKIGDIG